MSAASARLSPSDRNHVINELRHIVGARHVLTDDNETRRFRKGYRFGEGHALAVVQPASLVEQWRLLRCCIDHNLIVIPQAANTGLTGGSTPDGDDYDRDIVIISTTRLQKVHVIDDGKQVICLPGATLYQLEQELRPLGREPHSVIGSSCIGASVFGGVCNNSGGALIRRGPAFTEMSVFAQVDAQGQLSLVNHLSVELGEQPEAILERLDMGSFTAADINPSAGAGSDHHYHDHVRHIEADTPARFNADPRRLYESSGSAGKVMVFAVRLDTFPLEQNTKVFYIGTNQPEELTAIRQQILKNSKKLPISGEYMHREAFDIAEKYGKDTFLAIHFLGTDRLPKLFALKSRIDGFCARLRLPPLSDYIMQGLSHLFPRHLPERMRAYRDQFAHHLLLKVSADSVDETRDFLTEFFQNATGGFFECTPEEGTKAFLHRFAAAGAAVRYRAVHPREVEDILALDIALRRNDEHWVEQLPEDIEQGLTHKLYYGHFFCHVFHQDYIVKKGQDCLALEHKMWQILDQRGAEYPAEHNVGHLYPAKPELKQFYQQLDPCNCFNPGIGQTSKHQHYGSSAETDKAASTSTNQKAG